MSYSFKIFILLFFISKIYAQNNNYVIDFITTGHGLSHNYVTSIISDDLNIKWIATENGITKFNGYSYDYLKPGEKHKDLLNENIEVLFKDEGSNIWIGTKSGGLSFLDTKSNVIKNFNHLINLTNEVNPRITALEQDNKGNIWVGTFKKGVFVIDYKNNVLVEHFTFSSPVYSILKDFNGYMWFPEGRQLVKYIAQENRIYAYNVPGLISDLVSDPYRNKIWISTMNEDHNIYNYNYTTDLIETKKTNISSKFTKALSIDKYNRIWIGTWGNGVYRSNTALTEFKKVKLVSRISEKIKANYNTILEIHHDKNNVTWLATANGGVVKLIEANGFENVRELIKNNELFKHLNITAVYKNNDKLYLGTAYNGLFYGNSFSDLKKINTIKNTRINTLYQFKRNLFIGCNEGYYIFNLDLEKIIFFNNSTFIRKVTAFHIDSANNLYIGTQQRGFTVVNLKDINDNNAYNRYDDNSENLKKTASNRITGIKEDQKGNIWISSYNGIHLFNAKNETLKDQSILLKEKLPSTIINSIKIKDDYIWLATPGGLIKLRFDNQKLIIEDEITKKDGLNSDFICDVTFDTDSNLWISTHTEIVKYSPFNNSIINYNRSNGINTTSFNNKSIFKYNDTLYFGGIDNITFFEPQKITNIQTDPEIIFTNLRVHNNLIQYNEDSKILDQNFNYASKIKLTHKDNFFSIGFIANDYLGNLNIKYRYLLKGYQKDWIDLQNRNEINFTGLPSGNYTLKIEASRDNQTWNKSKAIDIILLSSPWKSPLALITYVLLIIFIAVYFLKSYRDKLNLRNNLEMARLDKKRELEIAESKLSFFTNISHEFRTPLTLIISPLQEILENKNITPNIINKLRYIEKNTNKLLDLINQLLDFRKADHGQLKLNISHGDFIKFSKEVYLYFKEAANSKKVNLKFKSNLEKINFSFDRNKMEIVLSNLISNAIKYTNDGDKIMMTIKTEGKFCIISIKDTGVGMNAKNIDKIFERFFQIKSANTAKMIGSGIGLYFSKKIIELHEGSIDVKSKKNIGTEFIIKLPMNQQFSDSEANKVEINLEVTTPYGPLEASLSQDTKTKLKTILLIDDNPDILNYLNDMLRDTYKTLQASNGLIGFEIASSENPDLVISDIMMPEKDGITLSKELKSQFITSHIPIILLTARSSSLFEIEGLKTGADDYITKPFNPSIVKARIANLLENRAKLQEHFSNKVRFEPTSKVTINTDLDSSRENRFLEKAMILVENNLHNSSFGIDDMKNELNMSQSTLYRKIKSLTGLSLTAFIRSIRLKNAASLILTEDMSLSQIAYEVGFNDYNYFKDTFKAQFNCLPSKYKEHINRT